MKNKNRILLACLFSLFATIGYAQGIEVKGTILDDMNEGLPGASVKIKGTQQGTVSDLDGHFTITVPSTNSVLVFSFIGYKTQEITVGSKRDMKVQMKDDSKLIDEVVIVGFGTQKKIHATAAVKTIDNKVLESRPVGNVVQGLQGTVAGLNITNDNGGGLGQTMEMNIRGVGSIGEGSNSKPLVLIDGMEGDLSTVNPNDVEDISVLKDAAAAAIYGSRAPFGVILITTKTGERGLAINYTGNVRISQPVAVPDMVDSYTYALMVNDAYGNAGGGDQFGAGQLVKILAYQQGKLPYGIEKVPDQDDWTWGQRSYGNTNWYDVFLKNATTSQEHNISVSGGGDKVSYYFSANYLDQTGLFNFADESYTRLTFNGKVNVKFNKIISMSWNSRLVNTNNEKPVAMDALFFHNLGRRSPLMPVLMPNGEYNRESLIPAIKDGGRNISKNQQFYNQLALVVEPIKDWKINVEVNSRLEDPRSSRQFNKLISSRPSGEAQYIMVTEGVADKFMVDPNNDSGAFIIQPAAGTSAYEKTLQHINYFNVNAYTNFHKKFGLHDFTLTAGMQSEYYYTETNRMATDDILLDSRPFMNSTADGMLISEKKGEWSSLGFFGRIDYAYNDCYLIGLTFREDGASRFPRSGRWASFPSISLGWNIAQESFWKPLYDAGFEYLKFRGIYGSLGNQNTQSFYSFYQQMTAKTGSLQFVSSGSTGKKGTILPVFKPYSVDLTWEKVENAGVGVDWGFFNNRLSGSFDWYQRTTKDMIGPAQAFAAVYGGDAPRTNNAELRTRGWELEIAWRDRVNKDFSYGISASLSDYKTVITKYDSTDKNLDKWYSGKKFGDMWGYEVIGIAKSDKEMENYLAQHSQEKIGSNWGGGDLMYRDLDGDGSVDPGSSKYDDHGDLKVIGNSTPRYAYSFTLEAQYKFIDFRAFFQGIGKRDLYFKDSAPFFGFAGEWQRSLYTDHLDYYRFVGSPLGANIDDPYYGRLRKDGNNIQVCDRFLQNGAYLRLKNLQIGFSLPQNAKYSKYIKKARIYISGENLLTFTKLRIYDPESVGNPDDSYGIGKAYPMYRVYSAGLELTF